MLKIYKIQYAKKKLEYVCYLTTEVHTKASIETQHCALEKHSLVMPPATPSWVTNTDTLRAAKILGQVILCKEKRGKSLDKPRNLPRFFS